MSYNILCDKYTTQQQYSYCPYWDLIWDYRKNLIISEIRQHAADIICLQEVETEKFYNFFLPELRRDGYEGMFAPKSRAKTMSDMDSRHVDGLAIFYKKRKFKLIRKHVVEFNQLAISAADGNDDMINRVMTKDDIGLVALLETRGEAFEDFRSMGGEDGTRSLCQPVFVCTTHIHWDPEVSTTNGIVNS
jgi:CCR4-NOT transcription complex subunit 6